jgi:hypothetical protein
MENILEFTARVRGRDGEDPLREITISKKNMKELGINIDIGEYVRVTVQKLNIR